VVLLITEDGLFLFHSKTFLFSGLEETSSGVWKLFTAVIIHAIAIVFCIGKSQSSGCKVSRIFPTEPVAWLQIFPRFFS
jgi:hypothetical protein